VIRILFYFLFFYVIRVWRGDDVRADNEIFFLKRWAPFFLLFSTPMMAAAAASGFFTIALENARQRRLSIQWEIDVGKK
jgi:hypothetical protein